MGRHAGVLALTFAFAGIVIAGATADPSGAKNSAPVMVVCGNTTYHAVANGNGQWTPAHDLNSNKILVPVVFGEQTQVITDAHGNQTTQTFPGATKGSAAPKGQPEVNCSYHIDFGPFPDGSSATVDGTVTG